MLKKAVTTGISVLLLGSLLAGCGGGKPASTSSDSGKATGSAGGAAKYTIRLGASQPADHPMTTTMNKFKELVEKNSNGQIKVEVYPANQLGSQNQMNEGVKNGTVTMTYSAIAYMGGSYDPDYNDFLLPFLVTKDTVNKAYAALDGDIGNKLNADMEKIGIKPLGYGPIGFRDLTNSKKSVKVPADLAGMKVRLQPNQVQIETFKALGANPTPMDFSEVYLGLQQKVIDAQENPLDIIYTNKFYEVQKYLSLTHHFYDYAGLWMNKAFYDSFPQDLQKVVSDAGQQAVMFHRQLYTQLEQDYMNKLQQSGMQVYQPTPDEMKQWQDASKSVYDKFLKDSKNPDLAKQIWAAVGHPVN
jgi:TRAP-type transport system periplasmic protein